MTELLYVFVSPPGLFGATLVIETWTRVINIIILHLEIWVQGLKNNLL